MKNKIKVSLSLKVTLITILVSAIVIASIGLVNLHLIDVTYKDVFFEGPTYETAAAHIQSLNATIGCEESLNDPDLLKNKTNFFLRSIPLEYRDNILKVTINLADEENNLFVAYSTDENLIGEPSNPHIWETDEGKISLNKDVYINENNTWYIPEIVDGLSILTILHPINLSCNKSGGVQGTYELVLCVEDAYNEFKEEMSGRGGWLLLISFVSLFALILTLLFLLRKTIVNPIIKFRDKTKIIGEGDLDTTVDISSNDELGELADAFNKMAEDLKKSRDKLKDYNQILEQLLDRKDDFIGQLGHDLKNPLQPLVGLLPMLIEKEKDPEIKEGLKVMLQNAEYMKDLIFDTLKLAKLRSQEIDFDMDKFNLRAESEEVIKTQKLYLKENNVSVENKIPSEIIVEADKLRLAEVFKNLITNAVKYTPEKKGKIVLDAKAQGKWVTVSITDNGVGMTKEQLEKVFDEFYKVNRKSSDYYSTGLGLSIAKRIIEKFGGKIWVESPGPDKGTTFYFSLKNKTKNN